jgi:hypothetical protein
LKGGVVAAFAEGGLVDPDVLSAAETGGDISNWVAKTFQGEIESNAQKTLRMIRENASKKQSIPQEQQPGVQSSPDSYESGPAGTSGDALTMARNLMRDLGLTEAQAAGIVGNMVAESGVENARPQGSKPGTKGPLVVDGVTGYGIVQWTSKGRQQALYNFAKSMGHDMSKPLPMDIEYKFFLKEFRESYGGVLKQIKDAKDTKTASTIFMQQYEIPAGYKTTAKIMERYNLSKPVYDKLAAGQGQSTKGKGSYNVPPGLAGTGPGVRSGGSIVNIGKELVSKGFQVAEHPDFTKFKGYTPGRGSVANVHKGKGHYQGRAIDVTDFRGTMEESKARYRSVLNSLYKKPGVSMLIHDSWGAMYPGMKEKYGPGSHGHPTHMHIETAYREGGETLPYPHLAMVGEEGKEIVIDNDSSVTKAKPMLLAINEAKDERGVMKAIQQYASYYGLSPQTIYVPTPSESDYGYDSEQSGGGIAFVPVGGGSDPFESLHRGG